MKNPNYYHFGILGTNQFPRYDFNDILEKYNIYIFIKKKITKKIIFAMWSKHLKLGVKSQTTYIMDQKEYYK